MIAAVIADDLTGAAEQASAAADLGFSCEVQSAFDGACGAEILCLDTNTRCVSSDQAAEVVARATRDVLRLNPDWIYKKTDSVLRGNVRAEIESILRTAALKSSLFVPANPSKSRLIRGGMYYVNDVPLAQTAFAHDPHHPRTTSDVRALLHGSRAPDCNIETPDVTCLDDLQRLAATLSAQTLAAGGVEFFQAVLQQRIGRRPAPDVPEKVDCPVLFCSGSLQGWSGASAEQFALRNVPAIAMPEGLRTSGPAPHGALDRWGRDVCDVLKNHRGAAVFIGDRCTAPPRLLTARLAEVVSVVLQQTRIATLVIEGGATASAVIEHLHVTRLHALPALALTGVAVLRSVQAPALSVLMKPGSYPWPPALWERLGLATGRTTKK